MKRVAQYRVYGDRGKIVKWWLIIFPVVGWRTSLSGLNGKGTALVEVFDIVEMSLFVGSIKGWRKEKEEKTTADSDDYDGQTDSTKWNLG